MEHCVRRHVVGICLIKLQEMGKGRHRRVWSVPGFQKSSAGPLGGYIMRAGIEFEDHV